MMKKRVAIIGVGDYATKMYIPAFAFVKNAEFVALMSKDPKDVEEWSAKTHLPGYTNAEEMMDKEKPDMVILAVYHNQFMPLIRSALERNIHILKEKPYFDLQEAKDIEKLMEHTKVKMQIGVQRRFSRDYQRFAQLVSQMKDKYYYIVEYSKRFEGSQGWRADKRIAGGGAIMDLGYHAIDILLWNFGLPTGVTAEYSSRAKIEPHYDTEDTTAIMVKYPELYGSITISRSLPDVERYRVFGSQEIMEFDSKTVRHLTARGEILSEENLATPKQEVVADQIDYFCEVIDGKVTPQATPQEHLEHMAFVNAAYESEKVGKFIDPHTYL